MKHKITEKLINLAYSVEDFKEDEANARHHNDKSIDAIAASLDQFGQRMPIIVRADTMVVTAGNGRLRAAKALGWTHIAAVIVDEDLKTATAYALADNKTAEISEWDEQNLADALAFLKSEDESMLAVTAFDDSDIQKLLAMTETEVSLDFDDDDDDTSKDPASANTEESSVKAESFKFRGYNIVLTEMDAASLDEGLKNYVDQNGTLEGAVAKMATALSK